MNHQEQNPAELPVVLPEPSRRRFVILAAALLMQMCLGATYSWSIFVTFLRQSTGLGQGLTQLPLTVFYFVFPLTMLVSGLLLVRMGPRKCAVMGGVIFGSGWILADLGRFHFLFVILGIGVLGGIGVGLAYIVPIATGMLWFPRQKGLVTGVAVAGFGGGAAVVSQLAEYLMAGRGLTPFAAFAVFGNIFMVLVVAGGLCMSNPPGFQRASSLVTRPAEILHDPFFRIFYFAMFAGLTAGLTINGNLKQLSSTIDPQTGAVGVAFFAIMNAVGRIFWGFLFDRTASSVVIKADLAAQALLLFAAPWLLRSTGGFWFFALSTGFNYGGVLVLYASSAAHRWGTIRIGQIYGWLFSANIPAAIMPTLGGLADDLTGSFTVPLLVIAVLLVSAVVFVPSLTKAVTEPVPIVERKTVM